MPEYPKAGGNATHTGEVTGSEALTVDKTAITNKSVVTAVGSDHVLVADASDTDNLKKVLISDFASAGGDMAAATYDPTTIAGDVFDMDNMVESATDKILTATERTKLGTIEENAKDDQSAAEVVNTPAGGIDATNVQAAIDELDAEKLSNVVEDITPQLGGDLDGQSNYLVNVQNFADASLSGARYHGEPNTADWIDTGSAILNGMDAFSLIVVAALENNPVAYAYMDLCRGNNTGLYTANDTNVFTFSVRDSAGTKSTSIAFSTDDRSAHVWGMTFESTVNGDGFPRGYRDGLLVVTGTNPAGTIVSSSNLGIMGDGSSRSWPGTVAKTLLFNLQLTETEMKQISGSELISFKYLDASNDSKTSGTLIIGKHYTIDTYIAGDDFTNIGGTNASNESFIATGTTPTTWTNSSSLRQTGCVLQLEPDGITHNQWLDKSENETHATVFGITLANLPVDNNIPDEYTPSAAATVTLDLNSSKIHDITMPAGNITIAVSNETNGDIFQVRILQDSVGSRTVTWMNTIKWASGSAPILTTTATKADTVIFRCTGTDIYDGFIVGQNI